MVGLKKLATTRLAKHLWYWTKVALALSIGLYIGEWMADQQYWIEQRYKLYQWLESKSARIPRVHRTVIVLIEDEEYWKGKAAGRAPINRAYLAELVTAISKANPEVIAIDFDLRSPLPDGSLIENHAYEGERKELLEAVKAAATTPSGKRTVVLAKTIGSQGGDYVYESDIYDDYDWQGANVKKGYIALPDDLRQVPTSLPIKNAGALDSFAEAIVRASEEKALVATAENDSLPYGTYLEPEAFTKFSATEVLSGDASVLGKLSHKIVILGGNWHSLAYDRGGGIDLWFTPVGWTPGAYIHANYVEALLDSRTAKPLETLGKVIEIALSFGVAIMFTLGFRFAWKLVIVVGLCLSSVVLSYFLWQNLGLFFDFFIPLVLIVAHFAYEHEAHLRRQLRELRATSATDIKG